MAGSMTAVNVNNLHLDLVSAFYTFDDAKQFFKNLMEIIKTAHPAITFLALEGMRHIQQANVRPPPCQYRFLEDTMKHINDAMHKCHNSLCLLRVYADWLDFYRDYIVLNFPEPIPQAQLNPGIDFLHAFMKYQVFYSLVQVSQAHPLVAVLALQGLHCVGYNFEPDKMVLHCESGISYWSVFRLRLKDWRCNSLFLDYGRYPFLGKPVPKILKALTIFTGLEVPLFIDDYGVKVPLVTFLPPLNVEQVPLVEPILINLSTLISHVTHKEEADKIRLQGIIPSDNKNSIRGVWFGISTSSSVYGGHAFQTTLEALGVAGLSQGEIIHYKDEVNVILYAEPHVSETTHLMKPTMKAVQVPFNPLKTVQVPFNPKAYVAVSIFVPEWFVQGKLFAYSPGIQHGASFCVKAKRLRIDCPDLPSYLG